MKKLFSTPEYKRKNSRHALNSLRRRIKRRKKGFQGSTKQSHESATANKALKSRFTPPIVKSLVTLKAPDEFSLIYNIEATLHYFDLAHNELKKRNKVRFDISQIKTLTTDAIAVLIAKIKDTSFMLKGTIAGNGPKDENLQQLFLQSGFYEYVKTKGPIPINDKKILIHKETLNKVEPDVAKEACLLGLKHSFNNQEIFEPLYNILIEIMQNTNNHAGYTRGKYDWWLHVYTHPNSSITSITFH